jgi:hypothetical protein
MDGFEVAARGHGERVVSVHRHLLVTVHFDGLYKPPTGRGLVSASVTSSTR